MGPGQQLLNTATPQAKCELFQGHGHSARLPMWPSWRPTFPEPHRSGHVQFAAEDLKGQHPDARRSATRQLYFGFRYIGKRYIAVIMAITLSRGFPSRALFIIAEAGRLQGRGHPARFPM